VEWPPKSPHIFITGGLKGGGDLNVMVYQVKIQNLDHLKEGIREAFARIIPDVLQRVRLEWERHIHTCYLCNGVHVQHICK
jgi:hypothetical protein